MIMRKVLLLMQLVFCLSSNAFGFIITSATAEEFKKAQESNYNIFIDMNSMHKRNCMELLKKEISRCYIQEDDYEIEYTIIGDTVFENYYSFRVIVNRK